MMSRIPFRLVLKHLLKHPIRSFLTIGSLTVAMFLLCVLRSVVVTLDAGVEAAKSDRIVVQSAVSLFVDLPKSYEEKIRAVDGVETTCKWSWFGGYYQDPSNFFAQFAVDQETLLSMYPEIKIVDGSAESFLASRKACLIGEDLAAEFEWEIGESVPIIGALFPRLDDRPWDFEVAGIYHSTSSNVDQRTMFFHFDYLDKSLEDGSASGPPGVGLYVAKIAAGADPVIVMRRIDEIFENGPQRVQSTSEAEFQAQFVSMMGNVPLFVSSIGTGVFLAILLAVVNTMLMAAREQTHDVGILKALGFGSPAVFLVLLLQSLVLTVAGGGLGLLLAAASAGPFRMVLAASGFPYDVSTETLAIGGGIAVLLGLLAGLAPAIRLSRLSAVGSLRAEV